MQSRGLTIFKERIRQSDIDVGDIVKISSSYQQPNVLSPPYPIYNLIGYIQLFCLAIIEPKVNKGAVPGIDRGTNLSCLIFRWVNSKRFKEVLVEEY